MTRIDATERDVVEVTLTASSVAGLRSIRRGLGEALTACGWGAPRIGDAQVVLAEIATNAFVHDAAPEFRADVTCSPVSLTMTTTHAGQVAPPPAPVPQVASSASPGGRGLVIVDQLSASRVATSVAGVTSTAITLLR